MKRPEYRFCQYCGQPTQQLTETDYICPAGHHFYNNPVVAAGVVLYNNAGEILFALRGNEPTQGKYKLPGGFVQFGESSEAAAKRELLEEAGLEIGKLELLTSVCNFYFDNYTTADNIYLAHSWQGQPKPQDDVAALEWRPLDFMISSDFAWPEVFRPVYELLQARV